MRITVITAITNNNDELRDDFPDSDAKFVAFLDKETKDASNSYLWATRACCSDSDEPRRNAKIHKVVPHLFIDTDVSIYLDANISLNISPEELVGLWLDDKNVTVCKHFERNCVYEEAAVCKTYKLDDPRLIDRQMNRYKKLGYPENNGMVECGVIVRRHTPEVNRMSEKWWEEICAGSSRDQLSFAFAFDNYRIIQENARFNPLFNYAEHSVLSSNKYEKFYV